MLVDGVTVPHFLYGTAWKENRTKTLVTLALDQGFRGIDTANQRKHYNEAAVGEGIREMINRGLIARKDLFIQTKFTQLHGQDHAYPMTLILPYPTRLNNRSSAHLNILGSKLLTVMFCTGHQLEAVSGGMIGQFGVLWKTFMIVAVPLY